MKSLVVVYSYHHNNTQKVADAMAKSLDAQTKTPQELNPLSIQDYDLVGFGAGIDSGKHYKPLLDFANELPKVTNKRAFIFSTSAIQGETKVADDHLALREILQSKGYLIAGEFSCLGYNTNSFLKLFGGKNKGRPNAEDLKHAETFAQNLRQSIERPL
jgi:flavodoxin